jgi:hypothetical protein
MSAAPSYVITGSPPRLDGHRAFQGRPQLTAAEARLLAQARRVGLRIVQERDGEVFYCGDRKARRDTVLRLLKLNYVVGAGDGLFGHSQTLLVIEPDTPPEPTGESQSIEASASVDRGRIEAPAGGLEPRDCLSGAVSPREAVTRTYPRAILPPRAAVLLCRHLLVEHMKEAAELLNSRRPQGMVLAWEPVNRSNILRRTAIFSSFRRR